MMVLAARTVNIRSWVSLEWIPLEHKWDTLMQVWVVRHDSPNRNDSAEAEGICGALTRIGSHHRHEYGSSSLSRRDILVSRAAVS
jgi:hypothetical protein